MIIFKDHISHDAIFTDAIKYKLVDDLYYEIEGKHVSESTAVSADIIGVNASAEATVANETSSVSRISFVNAYGLVQTSYEKNDFKSYIAAYMRKIKERLVNENPERVDKFTKGAKSKVKTILDNFSDWHMYFGESMDPNGIVVLVNYREDGVTVFGIVWKDGVYEEKA